MSKDPAILFYTADFLTGTMTMSDDEIGKYIKLLCLQHQKGKLSQEDINSVCKIDIQNILDKFDKDSDGFFYNKRLNEEINKRKKYCNSRRKNVLKRYINNNKTILNKSLKKEATYVEHMKNICSTSVLHMEDEDSISNININTNLNKNNLNTIKQLNTCILSTIDTQDNFESIWNLYPRKIGKKKAEIHFKKSVKTNDHVKKIKIALENYTKSKSFKDGYIQNGSTWFNNWEDWIDYQEKNYNTNKIANQKGVNLGW